MKKLWQGLVGAFNTIHRHMTAKMWRTWLSHFLIGFAMFLALRPTFGRGVAWSFVVGWFGAREEANVESKLPKIKTLAKGSVERRAAKSEMIVDGFFDFFAPIVACALADSILA